jgi:hypothetical protein
MAGQAALGGTAAVVEVDAPSWGERDSLSLTTRVMYPGELALHSGFVCSVGGLTACSALLRQLAANDVRELLKTEPALLGNGTVAVQSLSTSLQGELTAFDVAGSSAGVSRGGGGGRLGQAWLPVRPRPPLPLSRARTRQLQNAWTPEAYRLNFSRSILSDPIQTVPKALNPLKSA